MPTRPTPVAYASPVAMVADVPPASWRTAAAAAWLIGTLAVIGYAAGHLADDQRAIAGLFTLGPFPPGQAVALLVVGIGPAAFALAVGAVTVAVAYDRPVRRLAWVAAAPAVVGVWTMLPAVGGMLAGYGSDDARRVAAVVVVQAGLIFAGTRLGRPVGRWLARTLLPPPLRVPLVALWV